MTVAIATLTPGSIRMEWVQAALVANQDPFVTEISMIESGPYLDDSRNKAVQWFLHESEAEWLLFVDSDITFEMKDVRTLLPDAIADKPVVSGVYPSTFAPYGGPVVYRYDTDPDDGLQKFLRVEWSDIDDADRTPDGYVPVDGVGAGFLAIERQFLADMTAAFKVPKTPFAELVVNGVALGEDFSFCCRVKHLGQQIYIHPDVNLGHVKPLKLMRPAKEAS